MKLFNFFSLSISVLNGEQAELKDTENKLINMLSEKPLESVLLKPQKKPKTNSNIGPHWKPKQASNISPDWKGQSLGGGALGTKVDVLSHIKIQPKNEFFQQFMTQARSSTGTDNLQCLVCNESSYAKCYEKGQTQPCSGGSCFLEVRFRGQVPFQIQSGCQQKTACINNMKQNFSQKDWNENTNNHQCKLFSPGTLLNSVCHTCCFEDDCTNGWQPETLYDWTTIPDLSAAEHNMVFNQRASPPTAWSTDSLPLQVSKKQTPLGRQKKPSQRNLQKLNQLRSPKTTGKPKSVTPSKANQAMRFSLNVDKDGNVDQVWIQLKSKNK